MDWRDAPLWLNKMVIYKDARGEPHLYILRERRKDRSGRIFAVIEDMRVKKSFVRVDFEKIQPAILIAEDEDDE